MPRASWRTYGLVFAVGVTLACFLLEQVNWVWLARLEARRHLELAGRQIDDFSLSTHNHDRQAWHPLRERAVRSICLFQLWYLGLRYPAAEVLAAAIDGEQLPEVDEEAFDQEVERLRYKYGSMSIGGGAWREMLRTH